ncbi:hypothetical protein D9Q98_001383 [Chlorella vulgaris]|uniref:Mechanosensitive ion channel MscS domain-containing protein n=1 Tax=Chlorella vulgaris TaxID=3077 RepID=A0A9D4Z2M3_CHLVU|nr:hypothetical protein D9Q98_001383 [Chlorella vulgaris]
MTSTVAMAGGKGVLPGHARPALLPADHRIKALRAQRGGRGVPVAAAAFCRPASGFVLAPRPNVKAQAAPLAVAAAPVAPGVYQATGVPLVDSLMAMTSVEAAVRHSITLLVAAAVGVVVGTLLLQAVDRTIGTKQQQEKRRFNIASAAIRAASKPAQALLPLYGVAYAATVVSALAQVAATKLTKDHFSLLCGGRGDELVAVLKWLTQLVQDTSELLVVIFLAWFAIDFKNRVFAWIASHLLRHGADEGGIVQLLNPLSTLFSFFILLAAGTTALGAYGVNIGPLMASVGGISVAVGLVTQRLAANFVSGLSLYSGRAFVAGDRVQLLQSGRTVLEGVVLEIEPLRTKIRDDDGNPVYLSNTEVGQYGVRNLTQGAASRQAKPTPV